MGFSSPIRGAGEAGSLRRRLRFGRCSSFSRACRAHSNHSRSFWFVRHSARCRWPLGRDREPKDWRLISVSVSFVVSLVSAAAAGHASSDAGSFTRPAVAVRCCALGVRKSGRARIALPTLGIHILPPGIGACIARPLTGIGRRVVSRVRSTVLAQASTTHCEPPRACSAAIAGKRPRLRNAACRVGSASGSLGSSPKCWGDSPMPEQHWKECASLALSLGPFLLSMRKQPRLARLGLTEAWGYRER